MKTFIQLKDGIGWAFVNTDGNIEGAIEVEFNSGESYIKKKYENGVWLDSEVIRYAEVNENGNIIEIKRTNFPSDVSGPIMESEITAAHTWVDGAWVAPEVIEIQE